MHYNKMRNIFHDIGGLINASYVDMSNNSLAHIAPECGLMKHLQILKLNYNCLSTLPPELGSCDQLQNLELRFNYISGPLPGMCRFYCVFHSHMMCVMLCWCMMSCM